MNTLGRAFIIFNLVLSIAFFTIALMIGASHKNWKDEAIRLKGLAEEQGRLRVEAIKDQSENALQLRAEQFMRAQQIASSNTQVQTLVERLNTMTQELQTATQDKENYQNRLRESESRIAKQDTELERLGNENSELMDRVVAAKNEVVSLTNQKFNLQNQLSLLQEREANLAEQSAALSKVVKANNLDPSAPIANIQPRLDGEVAAVDRDLNMVVVTLGLDDGLREGHRLEIFRGGKYVGSALVLKSDPNRASARLIPETMQKLVQKGDNVTTKF